jgi:tetratricopeptide (TPR) repeat protein
MIQNNVPVNRQMIGEVYELIDIFPYFQSAYLLLLKGLYDNADVKFDNQLRKSAMHIGDRAILYWLLKTKAGSKTEKQEIKEEPGFKMETGVDTQQTVIESAKNSELMINEIEKKSGETELNEQPDNPDQDFGHPVMIATEPDILEPAGVIFLMEEETSPSEDKVFFMDPGFSIPEHSDLLELDVDEDETLVPQDKETFGERPDHDDSTSKKQLQSELIDKFIISNPRIEPQKDKSHLPNDDISKPFVEEAGGLVTETLAKIYISQGYYSKAMNIYEKLSLKFPEKSSYFASQIEKVKEYIKK